MKNKLIGIVMAVVLLGSLVFGAALVNADAPVLDHVQVTPASAPVLVGGTQQFSAQGYDSSNVTVAGLTYFWAVVAGGGTIDSTGLFTASNVTGTYTNTIRVIAVQDAIARIAFATVTVSAPVPGTLDHVLITPVSASVAVGGIQQFYAQGYDSSNVTVPGLTHTWAVAGGGNIDAAGLFTAGNVTSTYTNTVRVLTVQGNTVRMAFATVTVTPAVTPPTPPPLLNGIERLVSEVAKSVKGIPFNNLLGAQWTVSYNGTAYTIKATPGVINALSGTSLTLLPNGQTQTTSFTLPTGTKILPQGSALGVNDRVVVVTVNDQVWLVLKIGTPSPEPRMPPGLKKNDKSDRVDDRPMPPGWQKGKKMGWDKGDRHDDDDDEDDDD